MTDIGMPRAGDTVLDYTPLSADEDWKGLKKIKIGFTANLDRQGVERVCSHPDCITSLSNGNTTGLCAHHWRYRERRAGRRK